MFGTANGYTMEEMNRRLVVGLLASILSVSSSLWSQQQGSPCSVTSSYETMHEHNVAALKWSLYSVSKLAKAAPELWRAGAEDWDRLSDNAVYCLANIHSLRAEYLNCKIQGAEYNDLMSRNERFILLFLRSTSLPSFPSAGWIWDNEPSARLIADPALVVGDRAVPLDAHISDKIEEWIKRGKGSPRSPWFLAASELLGRAVVWDERAVVPEARVEINRGEKLSSAQLSECLSLLGKASWKDNVYVLSHYYSHR